MLIPINDVIMLLRQNKEKLRIQNEDDLYCVSAIEVDDRGNIIFISKEV